MRKDNIRYEWILAMIIVGVLVMWMGMASVQKVESDKEAVYNVAYEQGRKDAELDYYSIFFDDYIDLIVEYKDLESENAVLRERIKWLYTVNGTEESKELLNIMDDFVEAIIYYYENYDGDLSLEEWLLLNRTELYIKVMGLIG